MRSDSHQRHPTSIRLFLADGSPEGLRIVEKSNWTGKGMVCSRSDYARVRRRDEWARPGVYLLRGPAGGHGPQDALYVGEADQVRDRVDSHVKSKDFWTSVVVFISKDAYLNKAHVRYLEARLLQLATDAGRVAVLNGTAPALPPLSEADVADMEAYLSDMLLILPLVGVSDFEAVTQEVANEEMLTLTGKGAKAQGADTAEGFVVFEGSLARANEVKSIHAYMTDLRARLVEDAVLVPHDGHLRFAKPHLFNSPSTAAGVVLGRSANGRTEWKDTSGRTLKARQEAALAG